MQIAVHKNCLKFAIRYFVTIENKIKLIKLIETNNAIDTILNDFESQIIIAKI